MNETPNPGAEDFAKLKTRVAQLEEQVRTVTVELAELRKQGKPAKASSERVDDLLCWLADSPKKPRTFTDQYLAVIRHHGSSSLDDASDYLSRHSNLHERLTRVCGGNAPEQHSRYPHYYFDALNILLEWISITIRKKAEAKKLEEGASTQP